MFKKKPTASEVDGVQYRRAKTWQIICYACNALVGMSVYSLIGMASYSASIGYGITTAAVGIILTCSRILDGITDPLLAFVYDRVNTKFGKLRVLLVAGYLIEAAALYAMFTGFSSKGLGLPVFALLYVLYIIGYTVSNMTAQTIPAIMTNDPRQRPTLGVWTTAFNYLVPMVMSMVLNVVLLPKCGGTYNQAFLTAACNITLIVAAIGTLLVCLGVSAFDKHESFVGTKKAEPLKMADIVEVLKHNKPLQCYIASNASDKLAQQVGSQAIIGTLLGGIIIGNIGLGTILTVISMVPSIFFAAFGAKYVGINDCEKIILYRTRENDFLQVLSFVYKIFNRIFMSDTHYILFDNRTCIQLCRYVMACCTNNLHTSLEGGVIWFRTDERRKERMMNIDYLIRISINHLFGNHLHIACQYDKCNFMFGKQFHLFALLFFFRLLGDREQIERNSETFCYVLQIRMITYNKRYLYIPLSCRIPGQHIEKTVRQLGYENSHTWFYIREIKTKIHFIFLPVECSEIIFNFFLWNQKIFQFPFNTHEEDVLYMIYILIQIDNISFVYRNKVCHFR